MSDDIGRAIVEAYRWQRGLGARQVQTPFGHIVANPQLPDVWDANHVDAVTAATDDEIEALFAAVDRELAHAHWLVYHVDPFTPDAFVARLALDGFEERFVTIQMALQGEVRRAGAELDLRSVETDADWSALLDLVIENHADGRTTAALKLPPEFSARMVASYRAKQAHYRFSLAMVGDEPAAYGAYVVAPNGTGMIEDLFTRVAFRGRGLATGMIAAYAERLRATGCHVIFLGALVDESAKHLYAGLGFRPLLLSRTLVLHKRGA